MAATISANSAGGGGLVTSGDASGVLALQTAGVTALSIDASQKVTFANSLTSPTLVTPIINGMASSILTSGTAVASTSGTSIDFTGIPSWVKRITVMFNGVSTNGSSIGLVQLGSGSIDATSTYTGQGDSLTTSSSALNIFNSTANTIGFNLSTSITAGPTTALRGLATIVNITGNTWVFSSYLGQIIAGSGAGTGDKALSGVLDRIRITTLAGTDTFDAGSINIMYE